MAKLGNLLLALLLASPVSAELADRARELNAEANSLLNAGAEDKAIEALDGIISLYKDAGIDLCKNGFPLEAAFRVGEIYGFSKKGAEQYQQIADRCGDKEARRRQLEIEFVMTAEPAVRSLYSEAERISTRINRSGGTPELNAKRLALWKRITEEHPKSNLVPIILFFRAATLQNLMRDGTSPVSSLEAMDEAAKLFRRVLMEWPNARFTFKSRLMIGDEPIAPYAQYSLARLVGTEEEYKKVIEHFPNETDVLSGARFSANARIHLLNVYSDWEREKLPVDIAKAKQLANELIQRPNEGFAVGMYMGHTRPHALLILASVSMDQPAEAAKNYLRVLREYPELAGGPIGKDGLIPYGDHAKIKLNTLLQSLPETDGVRKSIEAELKKIGK